MAKLGADVDQLDSLAAYFEKAATTLDGHAGTIDGQIRAIWWRGSIADMFTAAWASVDRRRLTSTATGLREIAKRVRDNAAQQRAASGGGAVGPSTFGGVPAEDVDLHALGSAVIPAEGTDPQKVEAWWNSLSQEERDRLIKESPERIGNLAGVDPEDRYSANQISISNYVEDLRSKLDELKQAAESGGPFDLDIPGLEFMPDPMGDARDAVLKGRIAFLEEQITRYEELGSDSHQILFFSTENGGRIGEVHGDLSTADTIAIVVPGVSNDLNNFPTSDSNGARLANHTDPGTAVIEWLGYDTPSGLGDPGAASTNMAETGGHELHAFIKGLQAQTDAEVVISAHSYGTVVATEAAKLGMEVDRVVLIGSPGVSADNASVFGSAEVYAGKNDFDPIADHGHLLHGTDPMDSSFGAQIIECNSGNLTDSKSAHSAYYDPGSTALESISGVVNDDVLGRFETSDGRDVVVRREDDGTTVYSARSRY